MSRYTVVLILLAGCCLAAPRAAAMQLEDRIFVSPIANKPFQVTVMPIRSGSRLVVTDTGPADMGTDSDGCRHTSGINEYEYYVATCPYTYFSALTIEWKQEGQGRGGFRSPISDEIKQWVVSKDGFHGEWVMDKDKYYDRASRMAKAQGGTLPPIGDWVTPQSFIPVEKKFRLAIECYKKRQATNSFIGKVALTGAWAVRVRLNKPLLDSRLKGGINEINTKLLRYVEDGDEFDLDKFHDTYERIFSGSSLSDEGYFVAGMTLFGMHLRKGFLKESLQVLEKMRLRFDEEGSDMHQFLRGVIRKNRQTVKMEYLYFLDHCSRYLIAGLKREEFARARLPQIMLVVAESLRRQGMEERAAGWYLAIGEMVETKPQLRQEIRGMGKKPSVDAPFPMLIGWQADEQLAIVKERLRSDGVQLDENRPKHPDAALLNAIVHEGLGTPDFVNPRWTPIKQAGVKATTKVIKEVGLAVLDYTKRAKSWPAELGDLWTRGIIDDWNRVNRFHCPESGAPYLYKPIGGAVDGLPQNLVLVAGSKPVAAGSTQGYPLFLSSLDVVFSPRPVQPGTIFKPGGK